MADIRHFWISVKTRLSHLLRSHPGYILSTEALGDNVSIAYSQITMKEPCKYVTLYYSGNCISAYRKIIVLYFKYINHEYLNFDSIFYGLRDLVLGWNSSKVITTKNWQSIQSVIQKRISVLHQYHSSYDELFEEFSKLNVDDPSEMVDYVDMSLFKYSTFFPYRRAYHHFFKKQGFSDKVLSERYEKDVSYLDQMIRFMQYLYTNQDKTGNTDAFEAWKRAQKELIRAVQYMADLIEMDLRLIEKFRKAKETAICFKLYPKPHKK